MTESNSEWDSEPETDVMSKPATTHKNKLASKITALLIMAVWLVLFFDIFHINSPSLSFPALLLGTFGPSAAVFLLLKGWAFTRSTKPSGATRGFKISVLFFTIVALPLLIIFLQVWMYTGRL